MGYREYLESQELEVQNWSFYGLIMAAMRRADTDNTNKLAAAFPEVWQELRARYNAPGGHLPNEVLEVCSPANPKE